MGSYASSIRAAAAQRHECSQLRMLQLQLLLRCICMLQHCRMCSCLCLYSGLLKADTRSVLLLLLLLHSQGPPCTQCARATTGDTPHRQFCWHHRAWMWQLLCLGQWDRHCHEARELHGQLGGS